MMKRARRLLKIAPEGEKQLSIVAFGSARGGPKVCPIASVGIILKGYPSMTMSLFIVPIICDSLIGQPIGVYIKQNPHFSGLELADLADQGSGLKWILRLGLIIGTSCHWGCF